MISQRLEGLDRGIKWLQNELDLDDMTIYLMFFTKGVVMMTFLVWLF